MVHKEKQKNLTVCTLILAGCSGQKEQPITESQSVGTISQVAEKEENKEEPEPDTDLEKLEPEAPATTEAPTPAPTEQLKERVATIYEFVK